MSSGTQPKSTTFEDGVIGKLEAFFQTRFGLGKMWSRAISTVVFSTCLYKAILVDELGVVKPNIFVVDIGPSGLGMKSPPMRRARELIKAFNPEFLGLSIYTPPALREWISPDLNVKANEGRKFHLNFTMLRDEASTLFGEGRDYMRDLYELLSELWDGYLESYATRGYGNEGDVEVYVSMLGAGSLKILQLLDQAFFDQGLGNRILWVDEPVTYKEWDADFFFADSNDPDFEVLKDQTVEKMLWLERTCQRAVVVDGTLWLKWSNEVRERFGKTSDYATDQYLSKSLLNCLKLAICYAASRMSVNAADGIVAIMASDIEMAIADMKAYISMWKSVMAKWKATGSDIHAARIRSRKVDIRNVLAAGLKLGRFDKSMLKAELDTTDASAVRDTINQLVDDGRLVTVTGVDKFGNPTSGNLTDAEFKAFKSRGPLPVVYGVTEAGKKWLENNSQ